MKYRKKPVIVEAYQLTEAFLFPFVVGDNKYPKGLSLNSASYHSNTKLLDCWFGYVTTIHGQETKVTINDWVIAEPDGEHFYPCKPDIFNQTYELVTEEVK